MPIDCGFLKSETAPAYLTAIAAVLISPLINYIVTKIQIKADVVSKSRKEWVDSFRRTMAELLTMASRVFTESSREHLDPEKKAEYTENFYKFKTLMNMAILSLNPNGTEDERKLAGRIDGLIMHIRYSDQLNPELFHMDELDEIRALAQKVIKAGWDDVRKGK